MTDCAGAITIYYFGCGRNEIGHFLFRPSYGVTSMAEQDTVRKAIGRIDGAFCPGMPKDVERAWRTPDDQRQGIYKVSYRNGWTILGFWDRTADRRGNSNSNFIARGEFSGNDMLVMARIAHPHVFQRLDRAGIKLRPETEEAP